MVRSVGRNLDANRLAVFGMDVQVDRLPLDDSITGRLIMRPNLHAGSVGVGRKTWSPGFLTVYVTQRVQSGPVGLLSVLVATIASRQPRAETRAVA